MKFECNHTGPFIQDYFDRKGTVHVCQQNPSLWRVRKACSVAVLAALWTCLPQFTLLSHSQLCPLPVVLVIATVWVQKCRESSRSVIQAHPLPWDGRHWKSHFGASSPEAMSFWCFWLMHLYPHGTVHPTATSWPTA